MLKKVKSSLFLKNFASAHKIKTSPILLESRKIKSSNLTIPPKPKSQTGNTTHFRLSTLNFEPNLKCRQGPTFRLKPEI